MNYYVAQSDHARKLLLAGVNERVAELFRMTKVEGVLTKFPTVEAAEASFVGTAARNVAYVSSRCRLCLW